MIHGREKTQAPRTFPPPESAAVAYAVFMDRAQQKTPRVKTSTPDSPSGVTEKSANPSVARLPTVNGRLHSGAKKPASPRNCWVLVFMFFRLVFTHFYRS